MREVLAFLITALLFVAVFNPGGVVVLIDGKGHTLELGACCKDKTQPKEPTK